MDIYINYNFCGYRWFGIEDIYSEKEKVLLQESIHYEKHSKLLGGLITYDPYDIVFVEDNRELILAIRGIEDTRQDTYNRKHLEIAMILVGSRNDFDLLHKVMLACITYKKEFDTWVRSTLCSDVSNVTLDVQIFSKGLNKIQTTNILKFKGPGSLTYSTGVCFVCSNWSVEKIAKLLDMDKRKISSSIEKLEHYSINKWITNPFAVEKDSDISDNGKRSFKKQLILYVIIAFIVGTIIGIIL